MNPSARTETEARELLARLAEETRPTAPALGELVTAAIIAAEPALGADEAITRDLRRSAMANIERGLSLFATPETPAVTEAPREAIELATSMLRRGVEPQALIQAYRVGQNAFWRWWMDDVAEQVTDHHMLIAVLDLSSTRLFGYLDGVIEQLQRHYQVERERWLGGALARRAEVVHAILHGDDDIEAASRALGFELDRPLLALVLWRADEPERGEHALDGLERLAAAMAGAGGGGRALTVPAGTTTLWAWIAADGVDAELRAADAARAVRHEHEGAALGIARPGLEGFRGGHREALDARRVAELSGAGGAVIRYAEVEVAALVGADAERLRRFVGRTLGPLAIADDATAKLRESLAAWFDAGGNARVAAGALGTHKNTVLYRVQRAEEALGRPLRAGALDVQVALEAARRLGPAVLKPAE